MLIPEGGTMVDETTLANPFANDSFWRTSNHQSHLLYLLEVQKQPKKLQATLAAESITCNYKICYCPLYFPPCLQRLTCQVWLIDIDTFTIWLKFYFRDCWWVKLTTDFRGWFNGNDLFALTAHNLMPTVNFSVQICQPD